MHPIRLGKSARFMTEAGVITIAIDEPNERLMVTVERNHIGHTTFDRRTSGEIIGDYQI